MAPLMKAEVLVLFLLANRNAEAYQPGSKTGFWSHLREDFAKETGKQHKSLHRVLCRETERRRAYLDSLRTGQTDSESELTVQIDNWIDVVGEEERLNKERSEAANTVLTSSQWVQDIQDSLSVALAAKRKYQRNPPKSCDKSIGQRARELSGFDVDDDEELQSDNCEDISSINSPPFETSTPVYQSTSSARGQS
ncbi:hypothetical protein GMDG_08685, partial [Pseudogymnoascus destructans 20631-21]